ncbi:MAG: hypothetical protein BWK79_09410 [Beggiatoa sp. IS2]|nr:MAG: hypothetical protein BWK79_09410 [Beggiatoa sp. IS2]
MPQQSLVATLYNPHTQTKQELIDGFVVRLPLFRKLFAEIKTAEMRHPEQHLLIEGQRGMGKTTLLLRLAYEIENDADTCQRLLPIIFEEEAYYRINRLLQLWEETAKLLARREVAFHGLFEQMDAGYDEKRGKEWYEKFCFDLLLSAVQRRGKKLILLIDNFSELCNSFSKQENQRLREVLMTCSEIRWIGATAGTLEASFLYQHAFYEFFKKSPLVGLPREDTQELLLQLAKISGQEPVMQRILEQQPGRLETLRILTGGVIRTIVVLFEIFMDHDSGNAIHDLEKILDRVTPLYKHRMDDLPALQREVVTALAMNWDGMKLAEVAQKLRRSMAEVETPLVELKKVNLIEMKVVDAQTQWYFLEERFFNIWYLMRLATGARTRVIWLVRFLEAWYDKGQLMERAKLHIRAMQNNPEYSPKAAYLYAEAYKETGMLGWELEHELTRETREFLDLRDKSLARELSPADQELFGRAEDLFNKGEYEQAKALLLQIRQPEGKVYFGLGACFQGLKDSAESERYYLMAVEKEYIPGIFNRFSLDKNQQRESYLLMAIDKGNVFATFILASLYKHDLKDYCKAERYYLMSIDKGHSWVICNLAELYQNDLKDYAKAERYYLMAIDNGDMRAMFNLAWLYANEFKDYPKAERYYLMAIDKGYIPDYSAFKDNQQAAHYYLMAIDKGNVNAIFNLASLYENEFKDYPKAEHYYLMAIDKGNVDAMLNLAGLYENELKNYPKAEHYYLMAVEKGNVDAMVNLARLYHFDLKDYSKAEHFYLMAIEKGNIDAMINLAGLYHVVLKDYAKAEKYYLMGIDKGRVDAMQSLAFLYQTQFKDYSKAEHYYLMAVEKGNAFALNSVAWDYFTKKIHKHTALCCAEQAVAKNKADSIVDTLACIYLWHNRFAEAVEVAKAFIDKEDYYKEYPEDEMNVYLLLLLAKQQYTIVRDYFDNPQLTLKDRFKPIYYAFLKLTNDPEFGRKPPELEDTVTQLLAKVEEMAKDYA